MMSKEFIFKIMYKLISVVTLLFIIERSRRYTFEERIGSHIGFMIGFVLIVYYCARNKKIIKYEMDDFKSISIAAAILIACLYYRYLHGRISF
jgi:hypothetical protein